MQKSLLQDVLKPYGPDKDSLADQLSAATITAKPHRVSPPGSDREDSEDELVGVSSMPGTPARSRPASRPPSPTRGASRRPAPGPLLLSPRRVVQGITASDPLKAFPTELGQRIFALLGFKDLANCALVSKKWSRSQTINYVWFQHYRKDNFQDESLPPGKWTRRESKQNWRQTMLQNFRANAKANPTSFYPESNGTSSGRSRSGYSTPSNSNWGSLGDRNGTSSGYQTPREQREERWRTEAEAAAKPGKVEMREMYKELGGRKSRGKAKMGAVGGVGGRDKGGWDGAGDD